MSKQLNDDDSPLQFVPLLEFTISVFTKIKCLKLGNKAKGEHLVLSM